MSAQSVLSAETLFAPETSPRPRVRTRSRRVFRRRSSGIPKTKTQSELIVSENVGVKTSQILRELLTKNPNMKSFTIEKIVKSIGTTSFGTSLMFFSIPEVLPIPIPGISAIVVIPTAVIATQMVVGNQEVKLPQFMLKRAVPRKALAAAIHAILPVLERVEKMTKPRWEWATSPAATRFLGAFIFILAMAIAFPIPGFNMPQAISIFIIALGLVEKDGALVSIGVATGLASIALLGAVVLGLGSLVGIGV